MRRELRAGMDRRKIPVPQAQIPETAARAAVRAAAQAAARLAEVQPAAQAAAQIRLKGRFPRAPVIIFMRCGRWGRAMNDNECRLA